MTAGSLILVAVLWFMVGRPVENLTGALIDGLVADALTFCLVAVPAGAAGVGLARLTSRSIAE
jgi:hypothetical protein